MTGNERKLLALMDEWARLKDDRERHLEAFIERNDSGDWVNYEIAMKQASDASEAVCDFLRRMVL